MNEKEEFFQKTKKLKKERDQNKSDINEDKKIESFQKLLSFYFKEFNKEPTAYEIEDSKEIFEETASVFKYQKWCRIKDEKPVKSIVFNVSRYGNVKKTFIFEDPVTVRQAIVYAETYLSQKLTKKFYKQIMHDLFHEEYDWDKAKKLYECRGDCLTDCRYLESYEVDDSGKLTFFIGS